MASVSEFGMDRAPRRDEAEAVAAQEPRMVRTAARVGGGVLLGTAVVLAIASRMGPIRAFKRQGPARVLGRVAGDLGRGLVAGMVGTAAITTASTADQLVKEAIDARKEKRKANFDVVNAVVSPWSFSAEVVSKIFGIKPADPTHERALSVIAHWEYGSTWGLSLAAMRAFGIRRLAAMGMLLAGQLGAEMLVMPAFKLFSPPTQWGRRAIVGSVYQHAIYAIAAVSAFEWLCPDEA